MGGTGEHAASLAAEESACLSFVVPIIDSQERAAVEKCQQLCGCHSHHVAAFGVIFAGYFSGTGVGRGVWPQALLHVFPVLPSD